MSYLLNVSNFEQLHHGWQSYHSLVWCGVSNIHIPRGRG
jgi:hypothetical protein